MLGSVLAFSDDIVLPVSAIATAVSELGMRGVEQCDPQIITQASSLSMFLSPFPEFVTLIDLKFMFSMRVNVGNPLCLTPSVVCMCLQIEVATVCGLLFINLLAGNKDVIMSLKS